MNHWDYTWWMERVETYLGQELPPDKYVLFFDLWFRLKFNPRQAALHFTLAWNGPYR